MKPNLSKSLSPIIAAWPVLLFVALLPSVGDSAPVLGYLWSGELALAIFLLIAMFTDRPRIPTCTGKEALLLVAPMALFTVWSFGSIAWAGAQRPALHHSLLWACYLLFYLNVRKLAGSSRKASFSFTLTSMAVLVLGAACVIEHFGSVRPLTHAYTIRWYKFGELAAALLPIFLAAAIAGRSKKPILNYAAAVASWLLVLFSLSRTVLLASLAGLGTFVVLALLSGGLKKNARRLVTAGAVLLLCLAFSQAPFTSESDGTTVKRLAGTESSRQSLDSRLLFWGIAVETVKANPVLGVGADNYLRSYPTGREAYSALDRENPLLGGVEDLIPERVHNEYLQIVSELGIVGGLIFAWFLCGIGYMFFSALRNPPALPAIAALAGAAAFLVSSFASSYSFRVPANGICFFFVLSLAAHGVFGERNSKKAETSDRLRNSKGSSLLVPISAAVCTAMIAFSMIRGISLFYLGESLAAPDPAEAKMYIEKAILLDPGEPMFRFHHGVSLFNSGRTEESIRELRRAIDGGMANSTTYFALASAQMVAGDHAEAAKTCDEALRVYPRSVFLLTAHSSFLKRNGDLIRAEQEYDRALRIDEAQARSWRLAHDQGLEKLAQMVQADNRYLGVYALSPTEGPRVVDFFSRHLRPQ